MEPFIAITVLEPFRSIIQVCYSKIYLQISGLDQIQNLGLYWSVLAQPDRIGKIPGLGAVLGTRYLNN